MFKLNILLWCDNKLSYLKNNGITFKNGIPQMTDDFLYKGIPSAITTFKYRNDIMEDDRKNALLSFYMFEDALWPRLSKLDEEISVMKEYAGIVGFDLSPCVTMLRPRQRLSILINAIYSCYCGLNGIKVLPNYRAGDFGTIRAADFFPDKSRFIVGNLGCLKNGFKDYGYYELNIVLRKKDLDILFIVGGISNKDALSILTKHHIKLIVYPDRRNKVRNGVPTHLYYIANSKLVKTYCFNFKEMS